MSWTTFFKRVANVNPDVTGWDICEDVMLWTSIPPMIIWSDSARFDNSFNIENARKYVKITNFENFSRVAIIFNIGIFINRFISIEHKEFIWCIILINCHFFWRPAQLSSIPKKCLKICQCLQRSQHMIKPFNVNRVMVYCEAFI